MVPGTGSVFFGLSQSFQRLLLLVCPGVAQPGYRTDACPSRDLDYFELFSGKGNLSLELGNVSFTNQFCFACLLQVAKPGLGLLHLLYCEEVSAITRIIMSCRTTGARSILESAGMT